MRKGGHGQTSSGSIRRNPSASRLRLPDAKKSRPQSGVRRRPVSGKKREPLPKVPWDSTISASVLARKIAKVATAKIKVLREVDLPQLPDLVPKEASGISAWVPAPPRAIGKVEEAMPPGKMLPKMTEIANRVADRYAGGLNRLEQEQRSWRQKHDAYQRRKLSPNSSVKDFSHSEARRRAVHSFGDRLPPAPAAPPKQRQQRSRTFSRRFFTKPDEFEEPEETPEVDDLQEADVKDESLVAEIRRSFNQTKSHLVASQPLESHLIASQPLEEEEEEDEEDEQHEDEEDDMPEKLPEVSGAQGEKSLEQPLEESAAAGNDAAEVITAADTRAVAADATDRPVREAVRDLTDSKHHMEVFLDPQIEQARALVRQVVLRVLQRRPIPTSGTEEIAAALKTPPRSPSLGSSCSSSSISERKASKGSQQALPPKPYAVKKRVSMFAPSAAPRQSMSFDRPIKRPSVVESGRRPSAVEVDHQPDKKSTTPNFDECVSLAKKNRMTLANVRSMLEEFIRLDTSGTGLLSVDEFKQAIKDRCNIPAHRPLPIHLLDVNFQEADTNDDGMVSFEEFLLWSSNHAFIEELVVADPKERYLRSVARKHGFDIYQVEKVYATFTHGDSDRNASIDETEFKTIMAQLWGCDLSDIPPKRLRQFWLEADLKKLGKLNFEDFLVWYTNFGVRSA